ncbi:hypothetical protein HHK36_029728 [Tetracentron sinense]|uniref:Cytochrome P450 n=1 Tax=Tetracentron sinense TaxID=13715 RepID=A0A834YC72_TETSI|nr:hypothetical protein HHK36_029728 [Tetracentron sinense]
MHAHDVPHSDGQVPSSSPPNPAFHQPDPPSIDIVPLNSQVPSTTPAIDPSESISSASSSLDQLPPSSPSTGSIDLPAPTTSTCSNINDHPDELGASIMQPIPTTRACDIPGVVWLLWSWNELWFLTPLKAWSGATKLPPGHMGFPFFGEMINFLWYFKILGRPDDFIKSKQARYGDGVGMYRTHLFGSPSIIACSPAINKLILQSAELFPIAWPTVELVGHNSLVAVHGKPHARLRSYVSNAINQPEALKRIALLVQPHIVSSLQLWAEKGTVRAFDEVKKVTFANIGKFFISFEPGPILDTLDQHFEGLLKGMRAQPFDFPGTAYHHALQCRKKLMEIFRTELEIRKQNGNGSGARKDLMDGLMHMKDEEGKQLGDEEVLDNIASLIIGGYKSTSLALMWAIYYLAKFPDVLQKLRGENMAVCKNEKGDFINFENISQMKYTNKVVEETLRMANIAQIFFRLVSKDVDYQGYRIPKGWQVIVWARSIHTDPKNFEDPMVFNPDRWNEPPKPGTYQVFGGGPRICAGNMLARIQVAILLHHLVIGYKWELINPDAKMTYLPHPKPVDGVEIAISKI